MIKRKDKNHSDTNETGSFLITFATIIITIKEYLYNDIQRVKKLLHGFFQVQTASYSTFVANGGQK